MNIVVKLEKLVASVTMQQRERERASVRVSNSTTVCSQRRAQGCCLWVSYCTSSHHSDSISWGLWTLVVFPLFPVFHVKILCLRVFCFSGLDLVYSGYLHPHTHTSNRLWPVTILIDLEMWRFYIWWCRYPLSSPIERIKHVCVHKWKVSAFHL